MTSFLVSDVFHYHIAPLLTVHDVVQFMAADHHSLLLTKGYKIRDELDWQRVPKSYNHYFIVQKIGFETNTKIDVNEFPETITSIRFCDSFNQFILPGMLPKSLTSLKLDTEFNNYIDPQAICTLKQLSIVGNFEQVITFPKTLEYLYLFLDFYPYTIDFSHLINLKTLHFFGNCCFTESLPSLSSCASLRTLILDGFSDELRVGTLPDCIETLCLGSYFKKRLRPNYLPKNLTSLDLSNYNNKLSKDVLPITLKYLALNNYTRNISDGVLPDSLTHLTFGHDFNHRLYGKLPSHLESLQFGYQYNRELPILPDSLTELILGDRFAKNLPTHLPTNLTNLVLGKGFHSSIPFPLPRNLTNLIIPGEGFSQPIDWKLFPKSLTNLVLPPAYRNEYNDIDIPLNIITFYDSDDGSDNNEEDDDAEVDDDDDDDQFY